MQTSEDLFWGGELQNSGVVSPMHNFEASESNRALSDGFVESARNTYNPGGEIVEPPSQFSQGNGHFNMHEMLWAEDEIEPGVSRRAPANGLVKPTGNSSFSYREMLDPSFPEINQGDGFSYMHIDGGFHNASSYSSKDSKKALFETSNHREQFDFDSPDLVIHNQQPSDGKGTNLATFETPDYIETSSFNSFHKQDSSDFRHLKRERELFGMEYSFMPARGNKLEKPSSTFRNEYHSSQSHVKVEDSTVLTPSTDLVSRSSEVVDSVKNYGIHSKFETKEELSMRALASRGMPGDTSVESSAVVAQVQVSEHPGVMPPSSINTGSNNILKMENEAPKFYDSHISKASYQGVQSKTSEQSNGDDDSDLCILEDMSAPARSNHVAMSERFVGAKQVLTSREPGIQTVTHSRRKPNDERVIFRVALQVNSLASLCCL